MGSHPARQGLLGPAIASLMVTIIPRPRIKNRACGTARVNARVIARAYGGIRVCESRTCPLTIPHQFRPVAEDSTFLSD